MSFGYNDWAVSSFQIKAIALAINNHTPLEQTSSPQYFKCLHICMPLVFVRFNYVAWRASAKEHSFGGVTLV